MSKISKKEECPKLRKKFSAYNDALVAQLAKVLTNKPSSH